MSNDVVHNSNGIFVGLYENHNISDAIVYNLSLAALSTVTGSEVSPGKEQHVSLIINGADRPGFITYVIVNGREVESFIVSIAGLRGDEATYYALIDHQPNGAWIVTPNIVVETDHDGETLFSDLPIQDQLGFFLS